ncbi:hypothetical protein AB0F72_09025 [Actinoplanes sp. NPDC023936]|uniref:phage tail tube protein n=1 Tax=Actinoplanes sp. NPDC023936 TaxID=3154910 RepID=UPI0033D4F25E
MATFVVPKNALSFGAGTLLYSALGGSLPVHTVAGGIFTDAWPGNWNMLGVTREGHDFSVEINTEEVEVAEYLEAIANVTTSRSVGMEFELLQIHATNMRRVFNGGTLTTSGSGATLRTTFKLPQPGQEIRCMIGWESTDQTERIIAQQAYQIGSITTPRRKGAENAGLPVNFKFEPDSAGDPYAHEFAGPTRG